MRIYCSQCGRHAVFTRKARIRGRTRRIWRAHRDGHTLCPGCFRNQRNQIFAVMMAAKVPTAGQLAAAKRARGILNRLAAVEQIAGRPLATLQSIKGDLEKICSYGGSV